VNPIKCSVLKDNVNTAQRSAESLTSVIKLNTFMFIICTGFTTNMFEGILMSSPLVCIFPYPSLLHKNGGLC
jgi:hypothetical protein